MKAISIAVGVNIKIPAVPNFIIAEDGELKFPVSHFTDQQLRVIAEEWAVNLKENASSQRKNGTA